MQPNATSAIDALHAIPSDLPRDQWVRAGMSAQAAGLDFDAFNDWSAQAPNYQASDCRDTWRSFKPGKGVGADTLFKMAAEYSGAADKPKRTFHRSMRKAEPNKPNAQPRAGTSPAEVYERCDPATNLHPYIMDKGATGVPLDALRVVPADDPLTIQGESMAGALVVPVTRSDGTLSTLQFIAPPDVADRLKSKGKPGKLNLPGGKVDGWFTVGELAPGAVVYIVEGVGAAWSCWQETGSAAVACFGSGNMAKVAKALRQRDDTARLVICPDVGKESDADRIAAEVGAAVARMPEDWEQNADVNDLAQRDGYGTLQMLLEAATEPPVVYPLSVVFADELPDTFTPPDELVEGMLTTEAGSVLYGDSNSGKTFLAIDVCCAVARGVPWMNRRTEPGLVIYLAAESPASVRGRLQAYQRHHGVKVPNFAIVQNPIDLFDGDDDTNKVIQVIRQIETQRGQKARLVIGDTLARLSAGANENAGQDMGLVIRRFDRIRAECHVHFMLIHHCGKVAANGSRGWSGIRAAIETEIEVTDSLTGHCAEFTKQRDLGTKGERVGFKLNQVTLGLTKWGEPATCCVVTPADAPEAPKGKRMGEVEGAVIEFLVTRKSGIKKATLAKHFDGRYDRANIYRAVRTLLTSNAIHEASGMVCAAEAAK